MAYEHVRLELGPARLATLTIARPERLNALSGQTVTGLRSVEDQAPAAREKDWTAGAMPAP